MLRAAIKHASVKGYAFVIAYADQWDYLLCELGSLVGIEQRCREDVYLVGGGKVVFLSPNTPNVDLQQGLVRGAHPSCGVFADHHTLERWAGWALQELHRYDPTDRGET